MNKLARIILLIFLVVPLVSNGQSISDNLRYINEQFSKYNQYETSFRVDEYSKEIICEDKFGVLKAKIADIEVQIKGENIGIFCINSSSECIRHYKKDGTLKDSGYNDYTMGLRENEKLIRDVNTVLNKFAEIKSLMLGTTLSVSSSSSTSTSNNSISANLRYINEQFSKYNKYETSFRVDEYNKEIICEDKFGILKAKFSDVEIRTKGKNIGIFCINSSTSCIRSYDKIGNLKDASQKDYTMGLREGEELIPHINTVLNKFSEIRTTVLGNASSNNYNTNINIDKELQKINEIFQRGSQHKNVWRFDYSRNAIIGKTKNCEVIVPVNSGLSINNYNREGNYGNGWYFANADNSIIEACTSFKNNTKKTYEYVNSAAEAGRVITAFRNIIKNSGNGSSSFSTSGSTSTGGTSIESNLAYINEQFSRYNAYNTSFKIDKNTKKLIWSHDFGTNHAYFRDIEIRADYTNDWIGVYCVSSSKCIWQIANDNTRTEYKEYTMSLKENKEMIGHINTVVQSFETLKRLTLGNSTSSSNSNSDDTDSPD